MRESTANVVSWKSGGGGQAVANPIPSGKRGVPHRPLTDERKRLFIENLELLGSKNAAAVATDGRGTNTVRTYQVHAFKNPEFGAAVEGAMMRFADKVHQVVREHVLEGDLRPVVSGGRIVTRQDGTEVWVRSRDARIILNYLKRWWPEYRDVKTENVNVNVSGSLGSDPADPEFRVKSSDLWRLDSHEAATLTELLKKVHANRSETMVDITPPRELEEVTTIDAQYADETTEIDEDNPYDI